MVKDATQFGGAPACKTAFGRVQPGVQVTFETKPAASAETCPREVGEFFGDPH
jgi:hypothetical protein